MWRQMRYAREMMQSELPFWRMQPADSLIEGDSDAFGGAEVFTLTNEAYAVYLPAANGNEVLNLRDTTAHFQQRWFNPLTGEFTGVDDTIPASSSRRLGSPPSRPGEDWVVLVTRIDQSVVESPVQIAVEAPRFQAIPNPTVSVGEQFAITLTATDSDGTFPSVTVGQLPPGMRINGPGSGQLELIWSVPQAADNPSIVELIAIDSANNSLRTTQTMTIDVDSAGDGSGTGGQPSDSPVNDIAAPGSQVTDSSVGNSPPVLRPVPALAVKVNQRLSQRIVADDADGMPPSLIMLNAPEGSSLDDNGDGTRSFNWQPGSADIGTRTVTFIARDSSVPTFNDTLDIEVQVTR